MSGLNQESSPNLDREVALWRLGRRYVAGVDEAGRGALAGPVVAAAVIVPAGVLREGVWAQVRDSKLLTPARRVDLTGQICAAATSWGIGVVSAALIDQIGIAAATRLAMQQAIDGLDPQPDFLLIDWVRLPLVSIPQESVAKADRDRVSVAAASILAKVHRDRLLVETGAHYPYYRFGENKGYGTPRHLAALQHYGACPEHRYSFAPIAQTATLFADLSGCGTEHSTGVKGEDLP